MTDPIILMLKELLIGTQRLLEEATKFQAEARKRIQQLETENAELKLKLVRREGGGKWVT